MTANQKITTIWCVLTINKQLVELLFIKDEQFRESDITNYNSNINHKLSIDYKFELLLYNLDLLMAPIPEARPRGDLIQLTATSF